VDDAPACAPDEDEIAGSNRGTGHSRADCATRMRRGA
jgi:hypothetical protein